VSPRGYVGGVSLTSSALLGIVAVAAVVLPLGLVLTWRLRPGGVPGGLLRLVGIVLSQALAVGALGLYANDQYGFYNDWADLLGDANAGPGALDAAGLVPDDGSQGKVVSITVRIPGGRGPGASRLGVLVWLPKQYEQPAFANAKLPVVMVLPGQPGSPQAMFSGFRFGATATQAIDSGTVKPFVAVFAPLMITPPRDTECTDIPKGPQAETWLAKSVPEQVVRRVKRLEPPGPRWSALGFSTGGFCAAKLLLRHRPAFGAAVSIAGYFDALTDDTTGDLFRGSRQLQRENSPIWLIRQPPQQQTDLLVVVGAQDRSSWVPNAKYPYADSKKMIAESSGIPGVTSLVLPAGGHSYTTYRPTLPRALSWLTQVGAI
jgi:S-formylglutathione hydrolase FrmB